MRRKLLKELDVWRQTPIRKPLVLRVQVEGESIPMEVKGGQNVEARSLKNYIENHHPAHAIRFSEKLLEYRKPLISIPLYLAMRFKEIAFRCD